MSYTTCRVHSSILCHHAVQFPSSNTQRWWRLSCTPHSFLAHPTLLHNTMTDTHLTLFCVVDGESTSFPIKISSEETVGELKKLIKAEKPNYCEKIDAKDLTLWHVSLPVVPKKDRKAISLADVPSKEELDETDDISDVFQEMPPKKTIHIIVQRPLPGTLLTPHSWPRPLH